MTKPFITSAEVAARLGITTGSFRQQLDWLVDTQEFPQPMPYRGPNGAAIWRTAHVDAWLADQGLPKALTPPRIYDDPKVTRLMKEARSA